MFVNFDHTSMLFGVLMCDQFIQTCPFKRTKNKCKKDMDWFFYEEQHPITNQLLVFVGNIKFQ